MIFFHFPYLVKQTQNASLLLMVAEVLKYVMIYWQHAQHNTANNKGMRRNTCNHAGVFITDGSMHKRKGR